MIFELAILQDVLDPDIRIAQVAAYQYGSVAVEWFFLRAH
jgi:hypothetical protein